ncbi:hypothetical protein [Frankia sp. EI5c]|uniref:hypothetical protein n=1 Tax=Frankia sp. EI5c TaxID=683316 RepID=UPI000FF8961D|nr:hypothetical protein [Frankia sp. EI5c]
MRGARGAVLLSLGGWLVCFLGWILLLTSEAVLGCPALMHDSDYGQQSWVWGPPGNRCTWSLAEGTYVQDPPFARYGLILLFVLRPASTLLVAGAIRREGRGKAG